jgi:hypothetical protein
MCFARKLTFGLDIRLLMVRAVADDTAESALFLLLANHYRETPVTESNAIRSCIRLDRDDELLRFQSGRRARARVASPCAGVRPQTTGQLTTRGVLVIVTWPAFWAFVICA